MPVLPIARRTATAGWNEGHLVATSSAFLYHQDSQFARYQLQLRQAANLKWQNSRIATALVSRDLFPQWPIGIQEFSGMKPRQTWHTMDGSARLKRLSGRARSVRWLRCVARRLTTIRNQKQLIE